MSTSPEERTRLLERNLRALSFSTPDLVERIRSAESRADLVTRATDDGTIAGEVRVADATLRLCSFRGPLAEADRLAEAFDPKVVAVPVVIGFGMGHHVRAIHAKLKGQGAVIVFEPDMGLLRAVFSEIDCSPWLATPGIRIHAGPGDPGSITATFEGLEGQAAFGVKIIEHPPSRTRLNDRASEFIGNLSMAISTIRTHVVTTLCQVGKTASHYLSNAAVYASAGSVEELRDCAKGRTAVVVSAGPSLMRNVDQLARPGVRDRVVIIAAQTVLKPLLARGIKPHFVTALDHADISARFFEGLTAEDVRGVTLVVEPKANPAIAAAFPGAIRCSRERVLDEILGPSLAREMGTLRCGSTVAHLSYYLARFMGCDPVVLIGQDLGFTDGQYYSAGAAIHQVWAPELNEFNTLEMMEWQRIVRMRRILHRAKDHLGRPMYTDEQMLAYKLQFERDFGQDQAKGLTTLDATEGGVRKEFTKITTLAEALESALTSEPWTPPAVGDRHATVPVAAVLDRLDVLRKNVGQIRKLCAKTDESLVQMARHCGNHARVNPLIEKVSAIAREAQAMGPAYDLVQYINQTGQLKRYRRDRLIALSADGDAIGKQRKQIERDRENMRWLSDSAEEVFAMTSRAMDQIRGVSLGSVKADSVAKVTGEAGPKAGARVVAVVPVNTTTGGLDSPRSLAAPIAGGHGALWWTVTRLLAARELDLIVLATAEVGETRTLLGDLAQHPRVRIESFERDPMGERRGSVAAGRRWSRSCWRGGLGNLSVFDEAFAPVETAAILDKHRADAAVLVGADWCLVDPTSIDSLVTRYRAAGSETGTHQMLIVHAAPGLGACLVEQGPIDELARSGASAGPFSSIGALIGYLPFAPQMDLIGKPASLVPLVAARDLNARCIADSDWSRRVIAGVLTQEGPRASLKAVVEAFERAASTHPIAMVTLDLGQAGSWMSMETARRALAMAGEAPAVTLRAQGEATDHPDFAEIIAEARRVSARIHVVSRLTASAAEALRQAGVDVVSVPLVTSDGELDEDAGTAAAAYVDTIEAGTQGLPKAWVVPRLTRRDSIYEKIEELYDAWLMRTGACVIDALPAAIPGDRITPLPVPACAFERREREELVVETDGTARTPGGRVVRQGGVIEIKSGAQAAAEAA